MNIIYDHQAFSNQIVGGISRYFYELISREDCFEGVKCTLPLLYSRNRYLLASDRQVVLSFPFRGGPRFGIPLNRFLCERALKNSYYDIFHPTYYNPYFLDKIKEKKLVITIYDMIHEMYPQYMNSNDNTVNHKRILAERADRIHAISENTKKDIVHFLGVDPRKIDVIPLGSSLDELFDIEFAKHINVSYSDYVLFVGNRGWYKNFTNFVLAMSEIMQAHPTISIVCAGGGAFSLDETKLLNELKISRVCNINPTDAQLAELYRNAKCFVFPSLYEGFGVPLVEAISLGCPVAASRRSSFIEIGSGAVEYFNPENIDSIKRSILALISDDFDRIEFADRCRPVLKKYNWSECARLTLESYKKLLEQK